MLRKIPRPSRTICKNIAHLPLRSPQMQRIELSVTSAMWLLFASVLISQLPGIRRHRATYNIVFIITGFLIAISGALSRGYVRGRLRESGVSLESWVTIGEEVRYAEQYLKLALSPYFPRLPALLAIAGMPGAFLLMVLGLVLRQ